MKARWHDGTRPTRPTMARDPRNLAPCLSNRISNCKRKTNPSDERLYSCFIYLVLNKTCCERLRLGFSSLKVTTDDVYWSQVLCIFCKKTILLFMKHLGSIHESNHVRVRLQVSLLILSKFKRIN